MRSFLLKIHIYGGLLCSSYLLIFGVSSLNFNHHFGTPKDEKVIWERSLKVVNVEDDKALSEGVRDALGLFGWPLPWETKRETDGTFRFGLSRPGKHYMIRVFFDENRVQVEETRKGFWAVINALHALMRVPASRFITLWGAYTEFCTWVVLFSAASGVYLWTRRQRERWVGSLLLLGASSTFFILMFYILWRG
ncbi:MAG: hypothetical protein ACREQP_22825 [Candidatus Binatia bacterium]